ncbi:MAG TPA: HD domain-containing phosphohydrolase [Anaerolineales bacterium]|nr:HD domain-containing phosphohydrolase [Anaerolineales bacterium]
MKHLRIPVHLRIALIYAVFGGAWILFSDRLLALIVREPNLLTEIQTIKGWFFVLASALVIYLLLKNDPTLRKQAEIALHHSEERYHYLVELSPEAIFISRDGQIDFINPAGLVLLGAGNPEQVLGKTPFDLFHPDDHPHLRENLQHVLADHIAIPLNEGKILRLDGKILLVETVVAPFVDSNGEAIQIILHDVTDRRRSMEKIERQNQHLASLSAIDMAIISSLDLRVTLNVFLERVTSQLQVDAAVVLVLDPILNTLEYVTGRGFRSDGITRLKLRLGEDYAGQAASERRLVSIPNLPDSHRPRTQVEQIAGEGFVSFHAVPLLAKGKVKGVLEVFNRTALNPDQEWLDFFTTLARQAAIAIDNTELFENLQRSNDDLMAAYDKTIEGWSRALDLRDRETEGHTQRVTDLAVKLAYRLGMNDKEVSQVRRGALLHDIGKMGVPDSILLKPGSLTPDEWSVMRKHPVYAYDLLSPIAYLNQAIEIPHHHHEKWDGSGYPDGLSRGGIPASARLFALVDVWDALNSDRPYRPGWEARKVKEYLEAEAGRHFDPEYTQIFLKLLKT